MRIDRIAQQTLSVLCGALNGKAVQKGGGIYMYVYSWLTLLYSRKQHNAAKQLYSNKN